MSDKQAEKVNKVLVKAHAKHLRIAPRKLRLVSKMVQGRRASDAFTQLEHTNKKGALMVYKLLKSAVANAQNNFSMNPDALFIKEITCDMGPVMKRYFPRARGSAFVIRRKTSHLHVVLEERDSKLKKARFKIPQKAIVKDEEAKVEDIGTDSGKVQEETLQKSGSVKTRESVKASKVQQKRRLFNRKSGE